MSAFFITGVNRYLPIGLGHIFAGSMGVISVRCLLFLKSDLEIPKWPTIA